jgi:hypothetical protein
MLSWWGGWLLRLANVTQPAHKELGGGVGGRRHLSQPRSTLVSNSTLHFAEPLGGMEGWLVDVTRPDW